MKGQAQWVELIKLLSRLFHPLNDGLAARLDGEDVVVAGFPLHGLLTSDINITKASWNHSHVHVAARWNSGICVSP